MNVIEVKGLSKKYRIGKAEKRADTIMGTLVNGIKQPFQNLKQIRSLSKLDEDEESVFWALRDVSFEVKEGEVLGIIGHNGAGKSTLLKILSRITEPSAGEVRITGRVAALLEVGTGFHPELTGRENIYMNGTILGMRKKEIDKKLDEIVDFSGVEKYLDTPVKFYSSGMRVRLGFSVAAHLEPEILIIDEVLAVGDAEFQAKCLGKMESVAGEGRTVLFVSHNLEALRNICPTAILLKRGNIELMGDSQKVIGNYLSKMKTANIERLEWNEEEAPGNEFVKIKCVKVEYEGQQIFIDSPFKIVIEFWNSIPRFAASISLHFMSNTGDTVFNSFSQLNPLPILDLGLCRAECLIPGSFLNYGNYTIKFFIVRDKSVALFHLNKVLNIEILDKRDNMSWYGEIPGYVRPNFDFTVKNLS